MFLFIRIKIKSTKCNSFFFFVVTLLATVLFSCFTDFYFHSYAFNSFNLKHCTHRCKKKKKQLYYIPKDKSLFIVIIHYSSSVQYLLFLFNPKELFTNRGTTSSAWFQRISTFDTVSDTISAIDQIKKIDKSSLLLPGWNVVAALSLPIAQIIQTSLQLLFKPLHSHYCVYCVPLCTETLNREAPVPSRNTFAPHHNSSALF